MSDIGARLRRLRENRRMSVKDLAAAVGVSRSFIYQLERGEVSPSYSTLRGIAAALGTALPVLVGDEVPEEWLVARRESRRRLVLPATEAPRARNGTLRSRRGAGGHAATGAAATPTWRAELLPFLGHRNRRMQPIVVHVDPGARLDALPFEHEREDLFFVLSGEVVLVLRGGREIRLREGDAAYLLLETLEMVENRSDGAASCLWVASPAE